MCANLENWHIEHPNEINNEKTVSRGAKLLTGPRGCGKTTLLLKAYNEMRHRKDVFSVYVNFKTSLKNRTFIQKKYEWFLLVNQWLFLKIYKGIFKKFTRL